ncbi:MAG: single-stranded DNA-binding protein, partial [Planctomycetia bacterium]|nr:single-stranded DNA-binding protein [Planctomycetia bacterium]
MASYNRVVLMGNLTRDPEIRYIPSGMAVVDIGLAVNDRRKDASGNWIDEATFVDITLWGRNAEIVSEYCRKGSPVFIEGRLKLDSWETDGQKRSKLKVVGERVNLLGSRQNSGDGQQGWSRSGNQGSNYSAPSQGGYNNPTQGGYSNPPQGGYNSPP